MGDNYSFWLGKGREGKRSNTLIAPVWYVTSWCSHKWTYCQCLALCVFKNQAVLWCQANNKWTAPSCPWSCWWDHAGNHYRAQHNETWGGGVQFRLAYQQWPHVNTREIHLSNIQKPGCFTSFSREIDEKSQKLFLKIWTYTIVYTVQMNVVKILAAAVLSHGKSTVLFYRLQCPWEFISTEFASSVTPPKLLSLYFLWT